jgi:hypothetical protein
MTDAKYDGDLFKALTGSSTLLLKTGWSFFIIYIFLVLFFIIPR